jgi:D-alanine-D-alanine ligase
MPIEKKTIAVLMGGPGNEREVSLVSGKSVAEALAGYGASVIEVDLKDDDLNLPDDVDLVFNVIHGTFGEDGSLQKMLNARRIPYTGAGASSSELAFDKGLSKKRFSESGVPTPAFEFMAVKPGELPSMPLPYVIKPPREGSSVGVHIIHDQEQVGKAVEDVSKYDLVALVEEFISGKELTVGIIDGEALPVVHIQPRSGFYDMQNKYPWLGGGDGSDYFCPADLDDDTTRRVQEAALHAHQSLGVEVYSRVDVILSKEGIPYVLEVNTIPGMTETSLLPKAAISAGYDFPCLCERIAELSMDIRKR